MATLAIFGGSFNPPHVAHALAALYVLESHDVDRVLVIPTFKHAFDKALAPFADRLAMCRLAFAPLGDRVEISTIEEELADPSGKPSRTLHTLEALATRHPGAAFRLVIGADILREVDKWYRWADVARLAPPLVVGRAGYVAPPGMLTEEVVDLPAISSTEIRARLARGAPITPLVPRAVAAYIAERELYRP